MPEDSDALWYQDCIINNLFSNLWQETGDYYSEESDRDLFCMYLMISV